MLSFVLFSSGITQTSNHQSPVLGSPRSIVGYGVGAAGCVVAGAIPLLQGGEPLLQGGKPRLLRALRGMPVWEGIWVNM